ncbi:MAG: carbohydrate ABC transporter permease [Acidothermaceae bacterium]
MAVTASAIPPAVSVPPKRKGRSHLRGREGIAGWLFVSPALAGLALFVVLPIVLALYISFTKWSGTTSPFGSGAKWIGLQNYKNLLSGGGLTQQNFARSIENNFYFVLLVVPTQTLLALVLAVLVNGRFLKAKSFFRTAFYFPSVTSSVAITLVFIFLFQGSGAVNRLLSFVGIDGPNWFANSNGLIHNVLGLFGMHSPPGWAKHVVFTRSVWDWISGPSMAMCAIIVLVIWTTSGTFMLMFLAALQNISEEVEEASEIDGANAWQRFWRVTVPMLRPTLLLVLTLGLISTWQVFDQIFLTGNNAGTTTPAYLSYTTSFENFNFGSGAAIAFLLFALITVLTSAQRWVLRDKDER